jgi:hypothetical protein
MLNLFMIKFPPVVSTFWLLVMESFAGVLTEIRREVTRRNKKPLNRCRLRRGYGAPGKRLLANAFGVEAGNART